MRILYFDIDSLRPDHLGCYGYHRNTSPNIDAVARTGVRFNNCYVTDAPCLPSRTALWSGRFGIHNGVINHGGTAADPFVQGESRGFKSRLGQSSWMWLLRQAGLKTATVSTFGERHSAFHWYAGFNDIINIGKSGIETADEIEPLALDWLKKNGEADNWFLHVNLWDPHTPYRTPESFGDPFKDAPTPAWLTEEVRKQHWRGGGPHSAREVSGFGFEEWNIEYEKSWPQQPKVIDSMEKVRQMFDGYDRGTLYADAAIGRILNSLADQNLLDDTTVIISADHGESLGEFNIYGDHQTADQTCSRIPLIVRCPGITKARTDDALLYHFDFAATLIELAGGKVPLDIWDGRPFTNAFKSNQSAGREFLVLSQGAWSCQRSVRWSNYLCMRSYHDGYHAFPEVMLFDLAKDPHEQHDLAAARPDLVGTAMTKLDAWYAEMMRTATTPQDPMWTVIEEGGPLHTRGYLPRYLERLRATGRADFAQRLVANHPRGQ
jgi:choline-sulfatase